MLDKSMSDVDPRRGACLPTDEGLEELVFKELWRSMAGVSSQARLDGISRAAARSYARLRGAMGSRMRKSS